MNLRKLERALTECIPQLPVLKLLLEIRLDQIPLSPNEVAWIDECRLFRQVKDRSNEAILVHLLGLHVSLGVEARTERA